MRGCRVGSGVQVGLGQGSNSVFAKSLCSEINGTVFLSIEGHSEFCAVGFGKYFVITFNNLLFPVTPLYLSFNFSKISLSASGSPELLAGTLNRLCRPGTEKGVNLDLTDAEFVIIVSEVEQKCN